MGKSICCNKGSIRNYLTGRIFQVSDPGAGKTILITSRLHTDYAHWNGRKQIGINTISSFSLSGISFNVWAARGPAKAGARLTRHNVAVSNNYSS